MSHWLHPPTCYTNLFDVGAGREAESPGRWARAGYGDIAAGILGGLAAFLIVLGASAGVTRAAVWVFSVVGLLDFAVVLYTGVTTLVPDAPYAAFYPFVLIPTSVVPLFILTHIFALRALLRGARG